MAFQYFNSEIEYQGQDLHILRNNQPFPLHNFFKIDNTINYHYKFRLCGSEDVLIYEKIEITEFEENGVHKVFIKADKYIEGMDDRKINNFFISITVENNTGKRQTTVILVHLHDELEKVWTSPHTLTFRKGMAVKFGLMAKFTDGHYADISFYNDIEIRKINTSTAVKLNNKRIEYNPDGEYPSTFPVRLDNIVEVTIPPYFKNTFENILKVYGTIIIEDIGKLKLHRGEITKINERINLLFLSDGFNETSNAKEKDFIEIIDKFITNTLRNQVYSPWDILNSKINIWSYYTKDVNNVAILENEHVLINTGNNPIVADIDYLIRISDMVILDLIREITIKNNAGQVIDLDMINYIASLRKDYPFELAQFLELRQSPLGQSKFPALKADSVDTITLKNDNTITLSELCGKVGLPTFEDLNNNNVTIATKMSYWRDLGLVDNIKFKGDYPNSSGTLIDKEKFLTSYVFKIWKQLANRIFLEKPDTSYGVSLYKTNRESRERFISYSEINISKQKFPSDANTALNLFQFGKYISSIKGNSSETSNFGKIYYTEDGVPELGMINHEFQQNSVKQCDNIVILSRINTNASKGGNIGIPTNYGTIRKSILSLETDNTNFTKCSTVEANDKKPITYIPSTVSTDKRSMSLYNLILHELSHNYLKDEYAISDTNLLAESETFQKDVGTYFKNTNLQTNFELLNQSGDITGDKIKWRFPRVNKIGFGTEDIKNAASSNNYTVKVKINTTKGKIFVNGDKILLRKRFLFATDYISCTISSATQPNNESIQDITITTSQSITISDYKKYEYLIISPFWLDEAFIEYQELVHKAIRESISIRKKPLLSKDTSSSNRRLKQIPDTIFSNPIRLTGAIDSSRVVGLFASGSSGPYDFNEGIYHPTGFCVMRSIDPKVKDSLNRETANTFCPVCSYILIDYIDPLLHSEMDNKYGIYKV